MALTKYEQETNVNMNREEDYAVVDTRNARHIRAIQKDDRFTIVQSYKDEETGEVDSVIAHISLEHFDPLTGLRRKKQNLTDEQRAAAGERLAAARARAAAKRAQD